MKAEPMDEMAQRNRSLQVKLRDCDKVMANLRQYIAELEADCADMAESIVIEAAARHSDGHGSIHPALLANYQRDTSTAHKYTKTNRVKE